MPVLSSHTFRIVVSGRSCQSQRNVMWMWMRLLGRPEQEALEARLLVWKSGLASVLEVLSAARKPPASETAALVAAAA